MAHACRHHGLTLVEAALSIALIAVLLSILLPALTSARSHSFREHCVENQRRIGQAWQMYLADHEQTFPSVATQPGWRYGGCLFSAVNNNAFPDPKRPLTPYLPLFRTNDTHEVLWCCPGDHGISDSQIRVNTVGRSAFQSFGTSYRANALLMQPPQTTEDHPHTDPSNLLGLDDVEPRGMRRSEVTTAPSRLVLGGDAVWYEVAESTGRNAHWHRTPNAGNLLFLDGSVRFVAVKPKHIVGPVVFDPRMRGSVRVEHDRTDLDPDDATRQPQEPVEKP